MEVGEPQKMDQNNMNKFFNSSFFTQTPQKDNKQGMFPSGQQSIFGQPQPQARFGAGGQNPFVSGTGGSGAGMKSNIFGSTAPFGGNTSFGGGVQPGQVGGTFGSGFPSQQTVPNRFGTGGGVGGTGSTFGTGNVLGTGTAPFGTTESTGFGGGVQSGGGQPFTTGASSNMWGQPGSAPGQYNPFGGGQSSFLGDRSGTVNRPGFPSFGVSVGTKDHAYSQRKVREDNGSEVTLVHINGNENYSNKSVDELRSEDYTLGRKPITSEKAAETRPFTSFGGGFGGGSTGMDNKSQGTSIFGTAPAAAPPQPFVPTPSVAGGGATFGTPSPLFGGNVPSTGSGSGSMFGQTAPATNVTTAQVPLAQPPNTAAGGFPFQIAQPQQASSSGMFQQPSTTMFPSQQLGVQPQQSIFGGTVQPSVGIGYQGGYVQEPRIDRSDPFLLKDIKFEKAEREHIPLSKMFPQPIFKEEPQEQGISLQFRPPRSPVKDKIYTIPSVEEAKHMKEVHNLVIGFEDKGRIEYLDTVSGSEVTMANIQSKIYFSKELVTVNDPVGVGLNRRARVYVEGVFPYSRSVGDYIRGEQKEFPLKGIQERFVHGLKSDTVRKFVGYEYERGTYVYDVNHF